METKLIWMLSAFRLEEKALEKAVKIAKKKKLPAHERIEVKSSGVGIKKSRIMLKKHLEDQKPELVLITGIAGAVNPKLKAGDIVFPEKVCLVDDSNKIQKILDVPKLYEVKFRERLEKNKRVHTAPIVATVKRTYHAEDKDSLRRLNPDIYAVDMESYSLVDVLTKGKIPFVFFRVISDPYNMKFPKDAFIDALFRSKGIKRIFVFLCHPVSSFYLVMIMPAMLKSLRVLKECAVEFISSAVKPAGG
jgi:nucleoside phosphorylase